MQDEHLAERKILALPGKTQSKTTRVEIVVLEPETMAAAASDPAHRHKDLSE